MLRRPQFNDCSQYGNPMHVYVNFLLPWNRAESYFGLPISNTLFWGVSFPSIPPPHNLKTAGFVTWVNRRQLRPTSTMYLRFRVIFAGGCSRKFLYCDPIKAARRVGFVEVAYNKIANHTEFSVICDLVSDLAWVPVLISMEYDHSNLD